MEGIRLPEHWNNWELTQQLGAGSYGVVYLARSAGEDEESAAIKIIRIPRDSSEASGLYREYGSMQEVSRYYSDMVTDLVAEIQTLMSVKGCHNIVQIEDYHVERTPGSEYGWTIYIRMEYLQSFTEYLQMHDYSEKDAIHLGIDICRALEECQKAGIIHRDIKPDNILLSKTGEYKLSDFGVAKRLDVRDMTYSVKGTYSYMAPEIYYGRSYDKTVDIYSLGLVLFRVLNRNRDPFIDMSRQIVRFRDREDAMARRMGGEPIPQPVEGSEAISAVIAKACAFRPEDRYQSAAEMRVALEGLQKGEMYAGAPDEENNNRDQEAVTGNSGTDRPLPGQSIRTWIIPGIAIFLCIILAGLAGRYIIPSHKQGGENNERKQTSDQKEEDAGLIIDHVSCSPDGDAVCSLDRDGVLIISGTGSVEATQASTTLPWGNNKDDIKKIIIEEGIDYIGNYTFDSCYYLSEVDLPDGLRHIGDNAFLDCELLGTIDNIPESLTEIGWDAFKNTKWLNAQMDKDEFVILNGVLISYNGKGEIVTVPEEVHEISYQTFEGNQAVRKIILPKGLQRIRHMAFYDCQNLKEIVNLQGNKTITDIGYDVFEGTPWLASQLARGNGYAVIDGRLFAYQGQDEAITVPGEISEIVGCAFEDSESLEKITIPSTVKKIGEQAFYNCSHLKEVHFEDPVITEIAADTFSSCTSLSEIDIPDPVKSVGMEAFGGCTSLRKVTLPPSLESIDPTAFEGCGNIEKVDGAEYIDPDTIEMVFAGTVWYEVEYAK